MTEKKILAKIYVRPGNESIARMAVAFHAFGDLRADLVPIELPAGRRIVIQQVANEIVVYEEPAASEPQSLPAG